MNSKDDVLGYDHFSNLSYLVLEAGSLCNLHCRYCPRESLVESGNRPKKLMTLEEYDSVLQQLKKCPITHIKMHGLSEAMLIKNFDEYVTLVRKYFPYADITIVTNMQYRLEKTSLLSVLDNIDNLWLSMDGVGDTYEYIRTGAKWGRAVKFLNSLKSNVIEEIRKKKIHIQFTLSRENYLDLIEVYKIKNEYDLSSVRFNLVQEWKDSNKNEHLSYSDEIVAFLEPYKKDLMGVGGWEYKDCFWPYEGVFIDTYGDVRQCIMNYTMDPIGNVFKDNLRELYNYSRVYNNARDMLSNNTPPSQCGTCDYHLIGHEIARIHGEEFFHLPRNYKCKNNI